MGAEFDSGFINDPELKLTNKELNAEAEGVFEESAYNNGHGGYTGTLAEHTGHGVQIHRGKVFDTNEEAYEYISEHLDDDKWDAPHAVPVKGKGWCIAGWCSS